MFVVHNEDIRETWITSIKKLQPKGLLSVYIFLPMGIFPCTVEQTFKCMFSFGICSLLSRHIGASLKVGPLWWLSWCAHYALYRFHCNLMCIVCTYVDGIIFLPDNPLGCLIYSLSYMHMYCTYNVIRMYLRTYVLIIWKYIQYICTCL